MLRSVLRVFLVLVACLVVASRAEAAEWLVRSDQDEAVKALFGEAWSGPSGPFRVMRGRVLASSVVVSFVADGRSATLRLEHPDDVPPTPADGDAFTIVRRDKGIAVTATCDPACSPADAAPLRAVAEAVVERYAGGLFVKPEGSRPEAATAHRDAGLSWLDVRGASRALLVVALLLSVGSIVARARRPGERLPGLVQDMALVFVATIALAWAVTAPGMSNWYLDFLGEREVAADRLSVGSLAVEAPFRWLLHWDDRALFGTTLVLGALGAALVVGAFRAVLPRGTSVAGVLLFVASPLGVRSLWSGSPHVVVFFLFAALFFVWLRAVDEGRPLEVALGLVLVPALALSRAEAVVFAGVPLLWGVRRTKRGVQLSLAYLAVLVVSAWLAWRLVALPSGSPLPALEDRWQTAKALAQGLVFGNLFHPAGEPSWFPLPLAVLACLGAVLLLVQRPLLLAAVVASLVLPQLAVARLVNDEGLVGARYFLPVLPMLGLLAAVPLGQDAWPARLDVAARTRKIVPWVAFAVAELATLVGSLPRYRARYTYQDEYSFLRDALATAPARSRVYYVAVADDPAYRNDPDCCLDPRRSPLVLALPGVDFEPLGVDDEQELPDGKSQLYFESAVCSYGPTDETERRNPSVVGRLHDRCARLASDPRLEEIAAATVPARATWHVFPAPDVRLRLFRVK